MGTGAGINNLILDVLNLGSLLHIYTEMSNRQMDIEIQVQQKSSNGESPREVSAGSKKIHKLIPVGCTNVEKAR